MANAQHIDAIEPCPHCLIRVRVVRDLEWPEGHPYVCRACGAEVYPKSSFTVPGFETEPICRFCCQLNGFGGFCCDDARREGAPDA